MTDAYFAANLQPMLAPNKILILDEPLSRVQWPVLCSIKYNGVRATTAEGNWTSRSGKIVRMSEEVKKAFAPILEDSISRGVVRDGEFNSTSHNTVGQTLSILAGTIPMPDDFRFKCFYVMPCGVWNTRDILSINNCIPLETYGLRRYMAVKQNPLTCEGEFETLVRDTANLGREGYILINPRAKYTHGRIGIAAGVMFKYKFYAEPEEGVIVDLTLRQARAEGVEKKLDTFGYSAQVHTQDSFVDTGIAGSLVVKLNDKSIVKLPFPLGFDLQQRRRAVEQFNTELPHDLKGTYVQFRRLACEDKDKPIAVKKVEFRDTPTWEGDNA
jgi:hypothetical protein